MAVPIFKPQEQLVPQKMPIKTERDRIGNQLMQLFRSSDTGYFIKTFETSVSRPVRIIGNFEKILNEIKNKKNSKQKAAMFLDFVHKLSEEYRLRPNQTNMLGMKYDQYASDPAQVATTKKFNCFSGNLSFACFLYRLAEEANINIRVTINEVVSVSGSDYAGHVIGRVEVKGDGSRFFDITNASKESIEFTRRKNDKPNVYYAGDYKYTIGASYIVTDTTLRAAQIQQKIMTGETFSDNDLNFIFGMDPIFLSYLMDPIMKFAKDNAIEQIAARVKKISDANAKLRLSLHLIEYYDKKGKIIKAVEYTTMAAQAISNIIEQNRINQIKIMPYLTKFARAFRIATDYKVDYKVQKPISFSLHVAVAHGLAHGDRKELTYNLSKATEKERTDFFNTVYNAFHISRTRYKLVAERKGHAHLLLLENMAIIQFQLMMDELKYDKTTKGAEIKEKLAEHLKINCQALGLDLEKIAGIPKDYRLLKVDPTKRKYVAMFKRLQGLRNALEQEPKNIENILKKSYLSKEGQGLDYYLIDPKNAAIKKALSS